MYEKGFSDLDILLNKIRDIEIKQYAEEAINCYYAKAYRATIITIWIATVLDLYKKIESIYSMFGDSGAKSVLDNVEICKANGKALAWEKTILDNAKDTVKIINTEQYQRLKRIEEDRHKCAHPVTDENGSLYLPTAEEARAHIRNSIDILLSQNAIFGKNFADIIIKQIEGPYVGEEVESIEIQIKKYLKNSNDIFRKNLIVLLLKKIVCLDITDTQNYWLKYINTLKVLYNYNEIDFKELKEKIIVIINRVSNDHLPYLIKLFYSNPYFVEFLQENIKDKIELYAEKDSDIETMLQTIGYSEKCFHIIIDKYMDLPNWVTGQGYYNCTLQFLTLNYINNLKLLDSPLFRKLKQVAISTFVNAQDFNAADKYEVGMQVLKKYLNKEEIEQLLNLAPNNHSSQYGSNQLTKSIKFFVNLFNESISKYPDMITNWEIFANTKFLQDNEFLIDLIESKKQK